MTSSPLPHTTLVALDVLHWENEREAISEENMPTVDRRTAHGQTMFSCSISLNRRTAQRPCRFSTFNELAVLGRQGEKVYRFQYDVQECFERLRKLIQQEKHIIISKHSVATIAEFGRGGFQRR